MRVDPALLASFAPMDAMTPAVLGTLARSANFHKTEAGSILFDIGEAYATAFFLLDGAVQLEDAEGRILSSIEANEPDCKNRIGYPVPGRVAARSTRPTQTLSLDARLLDITATWDQCGCLEVGELSGKSPSSLAADACWMVRLLHMPLFQNLSPVNLQTVFHRMSEIRLEKSEIVVRQGDQGDYFYVVVEGKCVVMREVQGSKPLVLAKIGAGSCFGEEALIGEEPRNATVQMLSPGRLMRLAKEDFRKLLKTPLQRYLGHEDAARSVRAGTAKWLDVRLPAEYLSGHLPDSINLPLYLLRVKLRQLNPKLSYIVVCDSGRRSSVGAFLLAQEGLDAYLLDPNPPAAG